MTDNPIIYKRKELKAMAKSALSRRGVLLKLIFAIFLCAAIRMSAEIAAGAVYTAFCLVLPIAEPFFSLTLPTAFRLMSSFLMAPAVLGTYRLASMLAAGEDANLTEIFYYFAPRVYFRALGAYLLVALPIELYVSALGLFVDGTYYICEALAVGEEICAAIQSGIGVLALVVAVPLLLVYGLLFSVFAAVVNGEGQPLSACIRAALKATRRKLGEIFVLRFSFSPFVLLSLATVGMLFIAFTLPYMLLSYFYYNAVLFGKDPRPQITEEVTFDER